MKRVLTPGTIGAPIACYVPGIAVSAGGDVGPVYFSGQVATGAAGLVGEDDVRAQTVQVFSNISDVLAEAGCTLADLVALTIYLVAREDFPAFTEMRDEILIAAGVQTTSTVVIVSGLVVPEHKVEISGVAIRPSFDR